MIATPARAATLPYAGRARRRVALLGGTTNIGDVLVALRSLAHPGGLVEGPAIAAYEQAFARRIGVRFGVSFAAGRVELFGILQALGIGAGAEVLLQAPTHIVVPNAIRYTGATPVYVDCELDSYNIDVEDAERRIAPHTRALVLQHTFGIPADLDAVRDLVRRHGLDLIEDCVHALGATFAGKPVGSFGRAAFFSTEETKTISTTTGGVAVTDDAGLAARLRAFQQACEPPPAGLTARYVLKLAAHHALTEPRLHRFTRALYEAVGRRHPLPRPTATVELRAGRRRAHRHGCRGGAVRCRCRSRRRPVASMTPTLLRGRPTPAGMARQGAGPLDVVVRRLLFGADPARGTVIGVTSAIDGEGKTTIAGEIAESLAAAGSRERPALLVDCGASARPDRRAWQERYGLSEVERRACEALQVGGQPPAEALDQLRLRCAFVVIDMPSLLTDPVAAELARAVDRLYLVVRTGSTAAATIRQGLEWVDRDRIEGVILNDARRGPPRWLTRLVS